jgi:hypothetical protein
MTILEFIWGSFAVALFVAGLMALTILAEAYVYVPPQ